MSSISLWSGGFQRKSLLVIRAPVSGLLLAAGGMLLVAAPPASAAVVDYGSLSFTTNAPQSMWGNGAASILDKSIFIGPEWDTDPVQLGGFVGGETSTPAIPPIQITPAIPAVYTPAIPRKQITPRIRKCKWGVCITIPATYTPAIPRTQITPAIPAVYTPAVPSFDIDTTTGGQVEASTAGKVGLNFAVKADAGSVNADVTFDTSLDVPDVIDPLALFSLTGNSAFADMPSFDTNFPQLQAKAELVMGIKADLSGKVCLTGSCKEASTTIGFVDSNGNLDPAVIELISFNDDDENGVPSGKISILEFFEPAAFQFGEPIKVLGYTGAEVGNVTVHVPNLATEGELDGGLLTSSGAADILELKLDLDGIAQTAAGLPPVLGTGVEFGTEDIKVVMGYDLLDIEFGPILEIIQDFELKPTLMTDFAFSEPVFVEGYGAKQDFLSVPFAEIPQIALDVNQSVNVTPTFWLDADFSNTTRLGIDGEFVLDVLKASFALEGLGLSYDLGSLGPLFEFVKRFDVADLPALFEKTFKMAREGFGDILGDMFTLSTVSSDPAAPEPVLANGVAYLQTGSPVELSQELAAPTTDTFSFSFDYQFLTETGYLDVFLGGIQLGERIASPGQTNGFLTFSIDDLNTADYFGVDADLTALLKFVFDGPTGSVLLLDNVEMTGTTIENGNFDLAAVTNTLAGWQGAAATEAGIVSAVTLAAVPEPSSLALLLLGAAGLFWPRLAQRGRTAAGARVVA